MAFHQILEHLCFYWSLLYQTPLAHVRQFRPKQQRSPSDTSVVIPSHSINICPQETGQRQSFARGCSVQGARCSVQGAACRVQLAACSVQGAGCSVQGAGCSVQRAGCSLQGAGCSVQRAACSVQHGACSRGLQTAAVLIGRGTPAPQHPLAHGRCGRSGGRHQRHVTGPTSTAMVANPPTLLLC